jgi:magnesium transporter
METTTRLLLPEVTAALRDEPEQVAQLTEELHPADLADLVSALDPGLAQRLLNLLPSDVNARILESCEEEKRAELFATLAVSAMDSAVSVTDVMAADDRADLYAQLPDELRQQLLDAIEPEESRDIRQLLSYPEDTAGALMTTDFVALSAATTAAEAIDRVRENAAEMETIYQVYAVDSHGTLVGVVSLRDLVTSPARQAINEIMNPNVVAIAVDADQEEAARLIAKYDLLALPVVDRSYQLLGIITVDDVMDVVEEEATEDVHKLGAVEPLETSYLATPITQLVMARAPWLTSLFIASLASERVLEHYSAGAAMMLLWFVPLVLSSGGNSGSQSATLVIRAMAIGKLGVSHGGTILGRELLVGLFLGGVLGAIGILRILLSDQTRSLEMVGAIGLSLTAVVTIGALAGSGVPLLLKRLGIDPAVASTPLIASAMDMAGIVIYFEIATRLIA